MKITHLDNDGRAKMVDVSNKIATTRIATARSKVLMSALALEKIKSQQISKGDVLAVAQVAGIMAVKKTAELIPMCHNIFISGVEMSFCYVDDGIEITATVKTDAQTGVEMEALTAVSVAALTIYDMVKSIDKSMQITQTELIRKEGGKNGLYLKKL